MLGVELERACIFCKNVYAVVRQTRYMGKANNIAHTQLEECAQAGGHLDDLGLLDDCRDGHVLEWCLALFWLSRHARGERDNVVEQRDANLCGLSVGTSEQNSRLDLRADLVLLRYVCAPLGGSRVVSIGGRIDQAKDLANNGARCAVGDENVDCGTGEEDVDGWGVGQGVALGQDSSLRLVGRKLDDLAIRVEAGNQAHENSTLLDLGVLHLCAELALGQETLDLCVFQSKVHDQTVVFVAQNGSLEHEIGRDLALWHALVDELGVDGELQSLACSC